MRRLVREMTISHADFFRLLPLAMEPMPYTCLDSRIEARQGSRRASIDISEEKSFRLGALTLPSVSVTLESTGFSDEEWAGFLSRFDQVFQRGGG